MTSESVYEVLTINAELILEKDPHALVYSPSTLYPETSGEVLADPANIDGVCGGRSGRPGCGRPRAGGPV